MLKLNRVFHFLFSLVFLSLGACQDRPEITPKIQPLTSWRVSLSPTLEWIAPHLNVCALQNSRAAVLLAYPNENPDIDISWGEPANPAGKYSFEIGRDSLAFIVNPMNQLGGVKKADLASIFSGSTKSWKTLTDFSTMDSEGIKAASYPPSLDIQSILAAFFVGPQPKNSYLTLVPGPQSMRSFVANNSSSIGFLPASWLDSSVRQVEVLDKQPEDMVFPIVVVSRQEPGEDLRKWLLCLQAALRK
jgi:hypothetical protein